MATALVQKRLKSAADAVETCVESCEICSRHCIEAAQAEMVASAKLCSDCAVVCRACLVLLARDSRFHGEMCRISADACDACAQECEKYDDEIMQACAQACRQAAQECRQLAA